MEVEGRLVVRLCKYSRGEVADFITFGISGPNVAQKGSL